MDPSRKVNFASRLLMGQSNSFDIKTFRPNINSSLSISPAITRSQTAILAASFNRVTGG